jgi:serine/threonine protein kinase/tetratricopeptide (TPR) repeat protein
LIEIPGYTLLRPLGQGGMATVYLAVQQSLGREVALKILSTTPTQDANAAERFLREARIAASLHHPHIVPIHDFGIHEGVAFIAMELMLGGHVSPAEEGQRDSKAALQIVRDIASALDYAHSKGVVHRDIKPENILRRADGECVLSDFGIARGIETGNILTQEGTSVGTPQYMSPEQLRGEVVDGRSDLYSLGVVFYQLLTGQLPYRGSDGWAIGMQHISAAIPRLPPTMAREQILLDALMAKNPDARPQTGAEIIKQIDAMTSVATPAVTLPFVSPLPKAQGASWFSVNRLLLVSLMAVLIFVAYDKFIRASHNNPSIANVANSQPVSPPLPITQKSIAVMPFEDMSEAKDQGYFSDGMSEELLNRLAQVPELRVAGRSSALSFKGKSVSASEIGKQLNVGNVLEGSVRKDGENLRVTVQLINVADGFQMWSNSYDRKLTDIFAVQEDIASDVVAALKLKLLASSAAVAKHHVPAFETYDQFLLGRKKLSSGLGEDIALAVEAFSRAVALDPQYAEAYSGLAMAESFSAEYSNDASTAEAAFLRAQVAAEQAVALDPTLGDAYGARGYVRSVYQWDWEGASADFSVALGLDPTDARNQLRYGYHMATLGRLPEARIALERGTQLDPMFAPVWYWLGRIKAAQGDYQGARMALNRVLAVDQNFKSAEGYLGVILLLQGKAAEARAVFVRNGMQYAVVMADNDLKSADVAKKALDNLLVKNKSPNAYSMAVAYAWIGDKDQAFAWLEKAVEQHNGSILILKQDPLLRNLRSDPRYTLLLSKLKFPGP